MDRFPSVFLVFLSAFLLLGSPFCWAQNQVNDEPTRWEELPAAAPSAQAPAATAPSASPSTPAAPPAPLPSSVANRPKKAAGPLGTSHYQVRIWQTDGDCLWRIAEKVYGDRHKWRLIYLANKDVIRDPNRIYPKQRLKIPPADWQP